MKQEEIELIYTDSILLANALFDNSLKEAKIYAGKEIVNRILTDDFDIDPVEFEKSLNAAIKSEHGEYLVKRSLSSLEKMKTFKVKGINAGFALTKMKGTSDYSEIAAVHNCSKYGRLGVYLLKMAIDEGGIYLECFGEHLSKSVYATLGFEVYKIKEKARVNNNGEEENLYFMKLKDALIPKEDIRINDKN